MPEKVKKCVRDAAETINSIPVDKREMAVRLAETYAIGLATGMELAEAGKKEEEDDQCGRPMRKLPR